MLQPRTKQLISDIAASVSLATFCLLGVWVEMQAYLLDEYVQHFLPSSPWLILSAALLSTLGVSVVWFLLILAWRHAANPALRVVWAAALLLLLYVPLHELSKFAAGRIPWAAAQRLSPFLPALLVTAGLTVLLLLKSQRPVSIALSIALGMSFLLPIAIAHFILGYPSPVPRPPEFDNLRGKPQPSRLIVILFDEWDYGATFLDPQVRAFPALEKFRERAVFFTSANPPAADTVLSIPSVLTGRRWRESEPNGLGRLLLRESSADRPLELSRLPHVFRRVRSLGVTTAAAGWYLPYCRLFRDSLDECISVLPLQALPRENMVRRQGLLRAAASMAIEPFPFETMGIRNLRSAQQQTAIQTYDRIHRFALDAAGSADLGLVFIHYPIPHLPAIWDAQSRHPSDNPDLGYHGNLALLDQTVAEITRRIEQAGLADRTAIVLTSDHPFRVATWRDSPWIGDPAEIERLAQVTTPNVPLIISLPGMKERIEYTAPFETIDLYSLIQSWFRGEFRSGDQLVNYLSRRSPAAPSPRAAVHNPAPLSLLNPPPSAHPAAIHIR